MLVRRPQCWNAIPPFDDVMDIVSALKVRLNERE